MSGLPHGEFDSGPGYTIGLALCLLCGLTFSFNPHTVVVVLVDPQTRRPPDVGPDAEPITPDPAAVERAVQMPLCNGCLADKINPRLREQGRPEYDLPKESSR